MTAEPLTKLKTKQIEESVNALTGLGPYTKSTSAEPTLEQLKEIRLAFRFAEHRAAEKRNKEVKLGDEISFRLRKAPYNLTDTSLFWKKIAPLAKRNEVAPPDQSTRAGKYDELIYEYVTRHTLIKLEMANLASSRGHKLTEFCPYARKSFMDAIERNDLDFFRKVGDLLRKRQLKPEFWLEDGCDKLRAFLINHWVKEFDGVPPLYNQSIMG